MGFDILLAVFAVLAAATSAYGIKTAANAQKQASDYNADVDKKNAQAADQQALYDAEQERIKTKRILSAQQAAFSASGIDASSGSAQDVRQDTATEGELDALVSIYTGRTTANAGRNRATLDRMQGDNAQRAGNIGVAGSLLGSAGTINSRYSTSRTTNPGF